MDWIIFAFIALLCVAAGLLILVLARVAILLPSLTKLVERSVAQIPSGEKAPVNQRLLELEDSLRLGRISQQEYDSMRQEILNELRPS